jgi:hypothetical protein
VENASRLPLVCEGRFRSGEMDSPQTVILFYSGRSSIGVAEFLLDFPFIRSYKSVSECEVAALAAPRGERFTERLRVRHTGNAISQQPRSVNVSNGAHLAPRFIFGRRFRPRSVRPKSDAAGSRVVTLRRRRLPRPPVPSRGKSARNRRTGTRSRAWRETHRRGCRRRPPEFRRALC